MKPNIDFPCQEMVTIFMLDDDDIPIEYAMYILMKVFGIDFETARIKCIAAGHLGEVFVDRYSQDEAEKLLNEARLRNMIHEQELKFEMQED